jgi:hypothetical protein
MKRQMILSLCLTAFLLLAGSVSMQAQSSSSASYIVGLLVGSVSMHPQSSCSASCIFGLCACEVHCAPGETPLCKSGVFSSSCTCVKPSVFPRRAITQNEYDGAGALSQHLQDAGGSEGARLASLINEVVRTSREPSDRDYNAAEEAFADAYENASEETRELIAAWLEENGH